MEQFFDFILSFFKDVDLTSIFQFILSILGKNIK